MGAPVRITASRQVCQFVLTDLVLSQAHCYRLLAYLRLVQRHEVVYHFCWLVNLELYENASYMIIESERIIYKYVVVETRQQGYQSTISMISTDDNINMIDCLCSVLQPHLGYELRQDMRLLLFAGTTVWPWYRHMYERMYPMVLWSLLQC